MILCGTNPQISTANTLRWLYFSDNTRVLDQVATNGDCSSSLFPLYPPQPSAIAFQRHGPCYSDSGPRWLCTSHPHHGVPNWRFDRFLMGNDSGARPLPLLWPLSWAYSDRRVLIMDCQRRLSVCVACGWSLFYSPIVIQTLRQDAVFASDHKTFSMDLDVENYFGYETDAIPAKQLCQLQLEDQVKSGEYRQQLHKLFTNHNIYRRVTKIIARSNSHEWPILD
jgi:hypothetical protein